MRVLFDCLETCNGRVAHILPFLFSRTTAAEPMMNPKTMKPKRFWMTFKRR
jgi:hypothetical protein